MERYAIIIPAKDEAQCIGSTLRLWVSLRERERLNYSIVVVDGGSEDDTVRIAQPLADTVVVDEPAARMTIAAARNIGTATAPEATILFHTDADVTVPNLPALIAAADLAFEDEAVVAVTTNIRPNPEECRLADRAMHAFGNWLIRITLKRGGFLGRGECQIVRRKAFEDILGYRDELVVGEDCDLMRRLTRRGKVVFLTRECVYHSTRRFRRWGYPKTLAVYAREGLWLLLFRRSYLTRWEVVR